MSDLEIPLQAKVEEWRRRAAEGTLSVDEMMEAVKVMRAGRATAAATSARSRSAATPVDSAQLMADLDNIE